MNILHCLPPQKYVRMWGVLNNTKDVRLGKKSLSENMHKSAQLARNIWILVSPMLSLSLFPWCTYYCFLPCLPPYRKSWGHQHVTMELVFSQVQHITALLLSPFMERLFNFAKPQKAWLSQHCLQTAALIEYVPEPNEWVFSFWGSLQGGRLGFQVFGFFSFS